MTGLDDVRRDYRAAFVGYLPQRHEAPLHSGYQLGRSAVAQGFSLLDLVQVHHEILLEVLEQSAREDMADIAAAASEFLIEVLATYDMTQRAFRPER
jgi:hypothetical protein